MPHSSHPFRSSVLSRHIKIQIGRILFYLLIAVLGAHATFTAVNAARLLAPGLQAAKTDVFIGGDGDGRADPGETIQYTVQISNSGTSPLSGVVYHDPIDANITLVGGSLSASPLGIDDTFPVTVFGNVSIDSASTDAPFSVTANDYLGINPSATISTYEATSAQGGQITMTTSGADMGRFSYDPPAGFEGVDTFHYTLADNTNAASPAATRTAAVTIQVSGMVWFINNNAGACSSSCDGRLSHPFTTLGSFNTANALSGGLNPDNNDGIFLYESTAVYTGGVVLRNGQQLIGQDTTASLTGLIGTPPTGSAPLPVTNPGGTLAVIQNSGGNAVTLNQNNLIRGLSISNPSGAGMVGTNVANITVGADVTISGVSGTDLDLSGSAGGVVNFGATITNTAGRAVSIQNRSGGTVILNGPITSSNGTGIYLNGNSGGFINFTGAIVDNNGTGILLTNNTGATIIFSGGLTLNTGSNPAFTATGGGTLGICDENPCNGGATGLLANTLTTTTGTALNVNNTIIDHNNLEFRSISANGAASGILLNTTGSNGGLVVKGNGGSCSSIGTCTGGAIQHSTSDAISLTNTINPSFTRIAIQHAARSGIDGQQVTNFTLDNSFIDTVGTAAAGQYEESNIAFNDKGAFASAAITGGVVITNNTLTNARRHGIDIEDGSGTINNLVISNNTISSSTVSTVSLGHGILVIQQGSATTTAHLTTAAINANTIANFPSGSGIFVAGGSGNGSNNTPATLGANGTPISITGNLIHGSAGSRMGSNAIMVSFNGQVGVSNFEISNNGNAGNPLGYFQGLGISVFMGGTVTGTTTVSGNYIVSNQSIGAGSSGIGVQADDGPAALNNAAPDVNFIVMNNNVSVNEGTGIRVIARASNANMDVTIQSNTVTAPTMANRNGIRIDSGSAAGNVRTCLNISGNTSAGSGVTQGIGIRKQGTIATTNVFGIVNLTPSPTTGAAAAALIAANNPSGGGVDILSGDNFVGCTITAMAPGSGQTLALSQPETNPQAHPSVSAAARAGAAKNLTHAVPAQLAQLAAWVKTPRSPAALTMGGAARLFSPLQSGETVNVTIGDLPAGKSVTITFRVVVDGPSLPLGTIRITNQGMVHSNELGDVLTANAGPADCETGGETCTPVDRPDTTVVSLNRTAATPSNASTVTWQIVFADPLLNLGTANFSLVQDGSLSSAAISSVSETSGPPATTWNITVTTGTGDGALGLNLTGDAGLSHDVTNLPFTGQAYTIDRTPPPAPVILTPANGDATNDNTPTISGTAEANSTLTIFLDGSSIGTTSANGSGDWFFVPATALMDGMHTVKTTAADAAGNTSGDSNTNTFTVDTLPPHAPVVSTPANGSLTNDSTPAVTGTAEAGSTVTILVDGTPVGTTTANGSGNWTFTMVLALSDGMHSVKAAASDAAGNTGPDSASNTFTVDVTPPAAPVVITPANGSATNDSTPTVTGTAEANSTVAVFVDGSSVGTTTAGASGNFAFVPSAALSDGAHSVRATAADAAGNTSVNSNTNTFMVDSISPTVTLSSTAPDPTGIGAIPVTVQLSENINLLEGNIYPGNATISNFTAVDGDTYTFNLNPAGQGQVTADILADALQDAAGNGSNAAHLSRTYDSVAPVITLTSTPPNPTNQITFFIGFSADEPVAGFTCTLSLTNPSSSSTQNPCPSPTQVTVTSGRTGTLEVEANDLAGNHGTSSTTWTVDTTQPTVTIDQGAGQADPTGSGPINFTVVFSEPVSGFADAADVTLSGSAGATTAAISGGPTIYTVAVSGMTGDGTVVASIPAGAATDGATNGSTVSTSTDNSVLFDAAAPSVTVDQAAGQADPTNAIPIHFTVTFSEDVTGFTDPSDVTLSGAGGATTVSITGGPRVYSLAISGMTGPGAVIVSIPAGAAQDQVAKSNGASSSTDNTVTYDNVVPLVSVEQASGQADPAYASPIHFTAVFSEAINPSTFTYTDVALSGTASATTVAITEMAPNDGTTFDIAASGMTASGTVIAALNAAAVKDLAGNDSSTSTSSDNTVVFEATGAPTTTTLTASETPLFAGQSWTLTATVASGTGTPAGKVTFRDGGVFIGTVDLSAGTATLEVSTLPVGPHTITAEYQGGEGYAAGGSNSVLIRAKCFIIFTLIYG